MSELHINVFVDGGINGNPGPGAAAAVAMTEDGEHLAETARAIGKVTNNVAEYKALLLGIALARLVGATHVTFLSDSQVVVQQVGRYWAIRDPELGKLHGITTSRLYDGGFEEWKLRYIPRGQNRRADWLCNEILRPGKKKEPVFT